MSGRTREAWRRSKIYYKSKARIVLWTLFFAYCSLTSGTSLVKGGQSTNLNAGAGALKAGETAGRNNATNCTPPAILEFPPDPFTQKERQSGGVLFHFLVSAYIFYCLAVICDDYFVPSIEKICDALDLSNDVAGATFMAVATSSPELFTNVIGTFVTDGDIGLGTILGSAVFNILAVAACCGFAAKEALKLDWYSLTRDCIIYSIAVVMLIVILANQRIFWFEAFVLVAAYVLYIIVMWNNKKLRRYADKNSSKFKSFLGMFCRKKQPGEKTPLLASQIIFPEDQKQEKIVAPTEEDFVTGSEDNDEGEPYNLLRMPENASIWVKINWVIIWPMQAMYSATIPDCRKESLSRLYPVTFLMCIIHIGLQTYVASWMMTVIGYTLRIPDSVMGLTFLALGNSIPEAISSLIVSRQGRGSMSISNSIGSNTFDILMCLGLPWLIRTLAIASRGPNQDFILINSGGLEYSAVFLIFAVLGFYTILAANDFYLDKKVATICASLYGLFVLATSLIEMNVFFVLNLPTCSIED